jgi:hypothetical protein
LVNVSTFFISEVVLPVGLLALVGLLVVWVSQKLLVVCVDPLETKPIKPLAEALLLVINPVAYELLTFGMVDSICPTNPPTQLGLAVGIALLE